MKLTHQQMRSIRHQFDRLCKKIVRNEFRDSVREFKRYWHNKTLLTTELSDVESLGYFDTYPSDTVLFCVAGHTFNIKDDLVVSALFSLSEEKRNILLLYYFLELTDAEIGELIRLPKSSVHYKRKRSLKQLEGFMKRCITEVQE